MFSFKDIVSQEKIIKYFKEAIKNDNISHAYIISGDKGMGKKTIANAFALELTCEAENKPCLICHSCKQTIAETNTDIRYIKHEKPNIISVSEVREQLVKDTATRPFNSKYKIYIIDEANKLTKEAQNAILKTIEEPPSYVIIILLSDNMEVFLDTIKSRCVKLNMEYIKEDAILKYLKNKYGIDDDFLYSLATYARGNIGKAIDIYENPEKRLLYMENLRILREIKKSKMSEIIEFSKILKNREKSIIEFIDFARLWYRDILLLKSAKAYSEEKKLSNIIFKAEYKYLSELAREYSLVKISEILETLDITVDRINSNVNIDLSIFMLLEELSD